ncbi:sugar-binding transcriptional regulator [Ancylobacter sp. Lp-2]|uniref:sugar-binding transcriptional regulator n=1 Tax=Ancylobacter sp. Lp-2 TaxID=2881339 RepID=UPI001E39A3F3|nr:sugar-binding transcriptional regulator [Ancylobacter sp. Lp-2]MCB4769582.1 sugar-binding transcriptional regulator [Ancylobacter sp. Lp-2]
MAKRTERTGTAPSAQDATQFALDPVLTAAWLYYEEGLKQDEIAARFGISRATVFNLLQKARDEGAVSVSIDVARIGALRLAQALSRSSGLAECYVVPASGNDRPVAERIAGLGARVLEPRITAESVLGVAWGRTVMALSQALAPLHLPSTTIAQITGSAIGTYDFSPELCTSNIALKVGGRCVNMLAPGIVSSPEMKRLLMAEPIVAQHFALLRNCDITLFGVTDLGEGTSLMHSGFMTQPTLADYRAHGAVGFVSGYFFDADGQPVLTDLDARHLSMPREDFLAVPTRICVGGGPSKIAALTALLRGGYANVLVTDETTARAVLARIG